MPSAHAPMPPAGPPGPAGAVIHLADRLRRRQPNPTAPAPQPVPDDPALELALTVEAAFLGAGQSLTDPATAQTYDTTLQTVLLLVDGAHAQAVVDDEQWQALRGMLSEMKRAPELI
ncbi:VCBS domain-containing protein [Streptomyces cinereoruber]|uniref:VCBS domain-containing protein n=1 Tax=Streptomyces cinereoruber TaxID=67260 RepID=UPI00363100A3